VSKSFFVLGVAGRQRFERRACNCFNARQGQLCVLSTLVSCDAATCTHVHQVTPRPPSPAPGTGQSRSAKRRRAAAARRASTVSVGLCFAFELMLPMQTSSLSSAWAWQGEPADAGHSSGVVSRVQVLSCFGMAQPCGVHAVSVGRSYDALSVQHGSAAPLASPRPSPAEHTVRPA
jgi:hypothetical protein